MTKSAAVSAAESKKAKARQKEAAVKSGGIPDFEAIEASAGFRELMRQKKKFLFTTTALFLGLYLLFNIVISYTDWLSAPFIGDISWVWIFAFGLFAMTWILVTVYMKRAAKFDVMAEDTLKEFGYDKEENQ